MIRKIECNLGMNFIRVFDFVKFGFLRWYNFYSYFSILVVIKFTVNRDCLLLHSPPTWRPHTRSSFSCVTVTQKQKVTESSNLAYWVLVTTEVAMPFLGQKVKGQDDMVHKTQTQNLP